MGTIFNNSQKPYHVTLFDKQNPCNIDKQNKIVLAPGYNTISDLDLKELHDNDYFKTLISIGHILTNQSEIEIVKKLSKDKETAKVDK